jgi:hypothetical protein
VLIISENKLQMLPIQRLQLTIVRFELPLLKAKALAAIGQAVTHWQLIAAVHV